jgi:hypothetical protein
VLEGEPIGPTGKAAKYREQITQLEPEGALLPRPQREPVNLRLHTVRGLLRW